MDCNTLPSYDPLSHLDQIPPQIKGNESSPLNCDEIYTQLSAQAYARVPISLSKETVDDTIESFGKFLGAPEGIKMHMHLKIAQHHRRGDLGFTHREPDDYGDTKDFFHFHPKLLSEYQRFIEQNPDIKEFLENANKIWEIAAKVTEDILTILNPHLPNARDLVFNTEVPHLVLRILRYQWDQTQELLAKPHFDAGSFTLALAESSPGLRIGSCPDDLQLVEQIPEHAVFMLSSNSKNLIPQTDLKPGWHDVIMSDKSKIGQKCARWAIVMFIDGEGIYAPDRSETHPWDEKGNLLNLSNRT